MRIFLFQPAITGLASHHTGLSCPLLVVVAMLVNFQSAAALPHACSSWLSTDMCLLTHRTGELPFQHSPLQDVSQTLWLPEAALLVFLLERWGFSLIITRQHAPWFCQKELPSGKMKENGGKNKHTFHPHSSDHRSLLPAFRLKTQSSQGWADCYLVGLCRASQLG